jgi:RNA polymerase sigma-70 factor, ECF subfamily
VTFTDPQWLQEERRCLAALRRGERAAFRRLYDVFAPPLYARVLLPRLGDAQAAEDVLSDTFHTALERLDQYQDRGGSIWSWLVTIASNRTLDLQRARAAQGRALVGFHSMLAALSGDEAAVRPTDERDQQMDGVKLQRAVEGALAALNPRYRRALELRFFQDLPRATCAQELAVTVGTFDVLLLRALRSFRARWLDLKGDSAEVA